MRCCIFFVSDMMHDDGSNVAHASGAVGFRVKFTVAESYRQHAVQTTQTLVSLVWG
jgi:hypothetical protein